MIEFEVWFQRKDRRDNIIECSRGQDVQKLKRSYENVNQNPSSVPFIGHWESSVDSYNSKGIHYNFGN